VTKTDIYTTPLAEQPVEAHLNTVLWRLAVAAGLLERGQGDATVDPDELLAQLERRLSTNDAEIRARALEEAARIVEQQEPTYGNTTCWVHPGNFNAAKAIRAAANA
jgi:hypothetical protein